MILVVEDEADVREELVEMLELRRFAVRGAASVADGIDCVRERAFPLTLLTDLRLREGSGLDLIRAIRSDSGLSAKVVRSIMMTGHIDLTEQVQREIAKQDVPLLFKPVDFDVLLPLLAQDAVH
ncbi:response regulator [Citromicrobium bathyomarinum]|uniref:response regulator n=1 Tax=Citromicrobium bathyomarinum TaxID=72174 RepID=UPI00315A0E62